MSSESHHIEGESSAGPTEITGEGSPFLPADSDVRPTLSVVVPTLDEEEGIRECIGMIADAVVELGVSAEVIVSDSSTDRTPEIARGLGAIVVEPDRPFNRFCTHSKVLRRPDSSVIDHTPPIRSTVRIISN